MRFLLTLLLCLTLAPALHAEEIHVAAAISMKEALSDAAAAWKTQTGNDVQFALGSSGAMSAQIRNSHTIDLFISAAARQMDDLEKDKLIDPQTRRDVASNALVLVVPADARHHPQTFAELADPSIRRIAIGERRTVPAGEYATTLLTNLKLADVVKNKLVYGANVRQVLMFVERGEVDAGIVYATDAKVSGDHVKIAATAGTKDCPPIEYPAAVLAASDHANAAQQFLAFLTSDTGQKILAARGFLPPIPHKP